MNYSRHTKKNLKFERRFLILMLIVCMIALLISGQSERKAYAEIKKLESEVFLLEMDNSSLGRWNAILEVDNDIMGRIISEYEEREKTEQTSLGEYTITAYCGCEECCGKWALNRPEGIVYGASGIELIEGVSVASPLPFGTEIIIDGQTYISQDKTAEWIAEKYNNKIIDVYFNNHKNAIEFGKQVHEVYIKN